MGAKDSAVIFACGTESHILTSYVLSVTEYKATYKILLLQSHRAVPYAQRAKEIGIWDEVIVLDQDPGEYAQLFDRLSSQASVLHFFSWGFPHYNRLFSLCVSKGVTVALTDEGLLTYSPKRHLAGWLAQNPTSHALVVTGFDPDAVNQIWLFSPSMFCEPTVNEIREISALAFYRACRDHPELVTKFKALFGFPEYFSFSYRPYVYFRQYFSPIGVVSPEVDAWLDNRIRAPFPEELLFIKDHPAYSNPYYEKPATFDYHGPWEALILLKHIDPSRPIELPKVYISLSSSALVKSPILGEEGYYIFLYKLLEPYTLWRDDNLETIIGKLTSVYGHLRVFVPKTWEEFYQSLTQISQQIGAPVLGQVDFKGEMNHEREMLSRLYLKYWQKSKRLEEFQEKLQSQLAERERALEGLRLEMSKVEERAAGLEEQLAERERALEGLRLEMSKVEERAAGLEEQLAERERALEGLRAEIETKAQELDTLRQQKATFEQELANLRDYLNQREQVLQDLNSKLLEIYSSTAWQIVQWMWKVRLWLFPRGSWRERMAKFYFSLLFGLRIRKRIANLSSVRNKNSLSSSDIKKALSEQHWGVMATLIRFCCLF